MKDKQPRTYRKFFCPVCGHVEWIPEGESLSSDYRCPLCEAPAKAMLAVGGRKFERQGLALEEVAPKIWRAVKRPSFQPDFEHFSYLIQHPEGLFLYDAPPAINAAAIAAVGGLGKPRALIVSHGDFVGFAGEWAKALDIPCLMGHDQPLPGNLTEPDRRVDSAETPAAGLRLWPTPGHSSGSLSLYWQNAPGGPALFAGDALCVWRHKDDRVQLSVFQAPPPSPEALALLDLEVALLATCMGHLPDATPKLRGLKRAKQPCARPYLGETGGVWFSCR